MSGITIRLIEFDDFADSQQRVGAFLDRSEDVYRRYGGQPHTLSEDEQKAVTQEIERIAEELNVDPHSDLISPGARLVEFTSGSPIVWDHDWSLGHFFSEDSDYSFNTQALRLVKTDLYKLFEPTGDCFFQPEWSGVWDRADMAMAMEQAAGHTALDRVILDWVLDALWIVRATADAVAGYTLEHQSKLYLHWSD